MLEDPRSLEFLEFIDTSSVLMDVALGTSFPWSNQWNSPVDTQWNSPVDTTSTDPRQYGDGRSEVIPSFDGQHEMRVHFSVSNARVAPERRAGKLLE